MQHPLPAAVLAQGTSWVVSVLGHLHLTRGGSCLVSFLRPMAQSPVQLCFLIGTQEQGQLHHRGGTLPPLAPSMTWWDFMASDLTWPDTFL